MIGWQQAPEAAWDRQQRARRATQFTPDIDWGRVVRRPRRRGAGRHHITRHNPAPIRGWDLVREMAGSDAALTLMLTAVLTIPAFAAIVLSAPAQADTTDDYVVEHGITAVCEPLDADPTEDTVTRIGASLQDIGFEDTAGRIVADSVALFCPNHLPLLEQYVSARTTIEI